jgi:hypothetical protein
MTGLKIALTLMLCAFIYLVVGLTIEGCFSITLPIWPMLNLFGGGFVISLLSLLYIMWTEQL